MLKPRLLVVGFVVVTSADIHVAKGVLYIPAWLLIMLVRFTPTECVLGNGFCSHDSDGEPSRFQLRLGVELATRDRRRRLHHGV